MAAPTEIVLSQFAGGIKEDDNLAAADMSPRQWAAIDGFVLEDETMIRSQWPLQKVSTLTTMRALCPLVASTSSYLVGLDSQGRIFWTVAPADTAQAATTRAVTWTRLTTETGANAPSDTDYRFLCVQPFTGTTDHVSAVRIHSATTTKGCVLVYEKPDGTGLTSKVFTDSSPATEPGPAVNPNPQPVAGKYPRANTATMWGDTLVLGDVEYFATAPDGTTATSMANQQLKRYRNRMWFSVGGQYDTFNVMSITGDEVGPESVIVGLVPCDTGLLVFTTTATGRDGVVLFRGTPDSFTVEVLRSIGAPRRPAADLGHRPFATEWAAAGSTVWVDHLSNIWHTDGSSVIQLDKVGPKKPATSTAADHVVSIGNYLLAARGGRLLVMRMFETTGAWSSLKLPAGLTVRAMTVLDHCVYFTGTNGTVWRFTLADLAVSERGLADGAPLTLTLSTGTQDASGLSQDGRAASMLKLWTRYGLRASAAAPATNPASLKTFALAAGPAGSAVPTLTKTLDRPITARYNVVLHGIGPAVEASATATFTGDLRVESISLWALPTREANV